MAPEPRLAEASSVNSSPPARRQKSEEPLGSDVAASILKALIDRRVEHAAVFPLHLKTIYPSAGYQVTPEQIGSALDLMQAARRDTGIDTVIEKGLQFGLEAFRVESGCCTPHRIIRFAAEEQQRGIIIIVIVQPRISAPSWSATRQVPSLWQVDALCDSICNKAL